MIIFTHVPKTAGTTTRTLLKLMLPAGSVHEMFMCPWHEDVLGCAHADIIRLRRFGELRAVIGHISYGFHELIGLRRDEVKYVALLRDPVARVVSYWRNIGRLDDRYFAEYEDAGGRFCEIGEFVSAGDGEVENGMAKRLSGDASVSSAAGILDKYDLIGVQENYHDFAKRLAEMCGARYPLYCTSNTGPGAPPAISAKDRAAIYAANGIDLELYWEALRIAGGASRAPAIMSAARPLIYAAYRLKSAYGKHVSAVK